jgi:biopolymer transport protein ExbB
MSQAKATPKKASKNIIGVVTIPLAFVVSLIVYLKVLGDPSHFDAKGDPLPGDYFGIIYKGGPIVPILMAMFITTFTFAIERLLTITKAKGNGSIETFLQKVKFNLESNNIQAAIQECEKQKGSVANVIQAGLHKYTEMEKVADLTVEQKVLNISKEIEESTTLELPMLEKNLPILATIATVATLVALLGTVLGMIRAFAALASSGTPDPSALAAGISEALINTAIGIATSAFAIIFYNICTGMIDKLTYGIDEIGFSISQSFATKHSK